MTNYVTITNMWVNDARVFESKGTEYATVRGSESFKRKDDTKEFINYEFFTGEPRLVMVIKDVVAELEKERGFASLSVMAGIKGIKTSYKKDGQDVQLKNPVIELFANNVQMISRSDIGQMTKDSQAVRGPSKASQNNFKFAAATDELDDDIPF